jgi:hypothetical protein
MLLHGAQGRPQQHTLKRELTPIPCPIRGRDFAAAKRHRTTRQNYVTNCSSHNSAGSFGAALWPRKADLVLPLFLDRGSAPCCVMANNESGKNDQEQT